MTTKTASGRCLCAAITFKTHGVPRFVGHCHCESCRRQTGAIVATFVGFPNSQVTFAGERQTHTSSPGVSRGFCPKCGTPLSYESTEYPGEIHLYLSTFDEPEQFRATDHVFWNERVQGYDLHDNLPRRVAGEDKPVAWGPVDDA
jgi:hypothetical protein